jgi:hypothetical protein
VCKPWQLALDTRATLLFFSNKGSQRPGGLRQLLRETQLACSRVAAGALPHLPPGWRRRQSGAFISCGSVPTAPFPVGLRCKVST